MEVHPGNRDLITRPHSDFEGPVRMCIGCRNRYPKEDLLRLTVTVDGGVVWDERKRYPGRGAYVCTRKKCFQLAVERRSFAKAFRTPAAISDPDEFWSRILLSVSQ